MLNYIDELLPERLATMQRHGETDEVFVLLRGIVFYSWPAGMK